MIFDGRGAVSYTHLEARPDLELGAQAINFNILDQFVESDNENFITAMQIRVL